MDEETGLLTNVRNNVWTRRTPNQKTAILIGSVVLVALVIIGVALGVTAATSGEDDGPTLPPTISPSTLTPTAAPTTSGPTESPTIPPVTTTTSQPNVTTVTPNPPTTTDTPIPSNGTTTDTPAPTTVTQPSNVTTSEPPVTTTQSPPTTQPPTTIPPTSTLPPTTQPPTTQPPSTTEPPTTIRPTTQPPPTTKPPTTIPPTTQPPSTTQPPTTQPPTTQPPPTEAPTESPGVTCETEMCKSEGKRILSNMNLSANACEDFYQYSCGGYEATHKLPEDKGRFGTFDEANDVLIQRLIALYDSNGPENEAAPLKFVRNTYKGCANKDKLNEVGLGPVKKELLELGGWPIGGIPNTLGQYDFKNEIIKLLAHQESALVSVFVSPDAFDTSRYTISLDQPSFGLGRTDLITAKTDDKAKKLVEAYKNFIAKTVKLFNDGDANEIQEKVDQLVDFEIKLANLSAAPEDRRDHFAITYKTTFEKLQIEVTDFDWFDFLSNLYKRVAPEIELKREMYVIINDINYVKGLSVLLKELHDKGKTDVVANYLGWRYVQSNGYLTTNDFRDAEFEFDRVQKGVEKQTNMTERCVNVLASVLPQVVGRAYVDAYFSEESKKSAEEIIQHVLDNYEEAIKNKDWMDDETKKRSLEKTKKLKINTGYPNWIKKDDVLNEMYKFNTDADVDQAFEALKRISQVMAKNMYSKLLDPVDREKEWPMGPAIVNAAYDPSQNSITIPAAILQLVFFNESRPEYLNYGAIGAVIGHEIGHGFDDEGSQFDAEGNLDNWWTNKTKEGFNEKAKCFIDQYSSIVDDRVNMSLNGRNTLGENIADNGGVHLAYEAYKGLKKTEGKLPGMEQYSPEQMFFISYANNWCNLIRDETLRSRILYDPHSPAKYRINVPVANFDTFGEQFQCQKGSKMRPENQCVLW